MKIKALGYLIFGLLTSDEFQLGRRFRSFIYTAASRSRRQAKRDNHRTHQKVTGTFFFLSLSFNSSSLVAGSKMAAVLIPMRSRQFHLSISFLIADAAEWPLKPNSLEISWRILIGVFFKNKSRDTSRFEGNSFFVSMNESWFKFQEFIQHFHW